MILLPADRNQRRALLTMLGVAALMPLALALLGLVLLPVGGLLLSMSASDLTAGAYPFYYAGHYASLIRQEPVRSLEWWLSVPLTIVQWVLLALAFSRYAGQLSRWKQLLAACGVYAVVAALGTVACKALEVQLVWEWARM